MNVERARYWIIKGAQPSERVKWLFGKVGILPPAPVRIGNPEAYKVPRSVFREKMKKQKEEKAEKWKVIMKKVEERRTAKKALQKERYEKKKQIRIAKEITLRQSGVVTNTSS